MGELPDPVLEAAYRATRYIPDLPGGPVVLRVGETAPALDAWLVARGFTFWAWLTAFNPGSQRLSDDENARRLASLKGVLRTRGLMWADGRAIANDAGWPEEISVLVPGLACADALALAAEFQQKAILWAGVGSPVALVWRPEKS